MDEMKKLKNRWRSMMHRCHNDKSPHYANYGGRGITVCKRWHSFDNFLADMGMPPVDGLTIERINNDGPYSRENCVWATRAQQAVNRRTTVLVEGQPLTHKAVELGVCKATLKRNMDKGYSLDYRSPGFHGPPRAHLQKSVAYRHTKLNLISICDIDIRLTIQQWRYVMEKPDLSIFNRGAQYKYYKVKTRRRGHATFQVWRWRCANKEYDLGRVVKGEGFWDMVYRKWGS